MDKNKEFIREIKINKKKRFKYNVITLIFLNFLLLLSLIYMCSLIKRWWIILFGVVVFVGCLIGSAKTILNAKENRKYVIYRDKISIQSSTMVTEIPLKNVFMVKRRRNILEYLFKRDAHMILISVKNPHNQFYMLPFIDEDVNLLVDEIMELAITARLLNRENAELQTEQFEKTENKKQGKNRQTILERVEELLIQTEENSNKELADNTNQNAENLDKKLENSKNNNLAKQTKSNKKSKKQ